MNKLFGTFAFAVVGAIICSIAGFYLFAAPVAGGIVGGLLYGATGQGKSINDRQG
ncbi:MAG: hypothetical protein ACRYFX_19015 [Janthinobacterium lividum]